MKGRPRRCGPPGRTSACDTTLQGSLCSASKGRVETDRMTLPSQGGIGHLPWRPQPIGRWQPGARGSRQRWRSGRRECPSRRSPELRQSAWPSARSQLCLAREVARVQRTSLSSPRRARRRQRRGSLGREPPKERWARAPRRPTTRWSPGLSSTAFACDSTEGGWVADHLLGVAAGRRRCIRWGLRRFQVDDDVGPGRDLGGVSSVSQVVLESLDGGGDVLR